MMKYLLPVPLAALIGFLAFGRGVDTKVPKPQPKGETAPTPPHIEISRRGQELVRKGEADLQLRKQKVQEKLSLLAERFDDLQTNAVQAESRWKLAIDRAFSVPRKAAEKLLDDYKMYQASEAAFAAKARYSSQTAGYLGAIGAAPLPYPQRDRQYLVKLHESCLMYSQAIDSFKSDADAARLALVDDISRVRDELVSLQLTIKDVETSGIDVRQMERDAVTKALSLIKELGPFLTHEMIPKLPSQADGREDPSVGLDDLSSLTEWIGQATVSAGEVLRMAIERESKSAVFVEADKIVDLVKRVGAP